MTLLDSDDEDDEKVEAKVKTPKAKAKIQEITLSDSEDEGSDASDEYMPSPKKQKNGKSKGEDSGEEDDDDDSEGELGRSGDEATPPAEKKKTFSAKSDFRSSTKLEALVKSLQAAREKDSKLKAVVFSQVGHFPSLCCA